MLTPISLECGQLSQFLFIKLQVENPNVGELGLLSPSPLYQFGEHLYELRIASL